MPSGKSVKRKLDQKLIKKFGLETTFRRYSTTTVARNKYGEPLATPWPYESFDIKIVLDSEKRQLDQEDIGGLSDNKREMILFYCKGEIDIRIGDKVIYPAASDNQWNVQRIDPNMYKGTNVITEVRAYRDDRY